MPDIESPTSTRPAFAERQRGRRVPLMTEVAIVTTLALIAAPIVLVAGTLAAAAKKRLSRGRHRGPHGDPSAEAKEEPSQLKVQRAGT